jgi:xylulose-5-phosphate/fructose-6-phosphate phosphoketolase
MNRVIRARDIDAIFIAGPGHGGPALTANTWLEGSYTEVYPSVTRDAEGMKRLFRQFSFPGGVGSHATPETPGSIHEGGELGYALAHAFGAAFDNPGLLVCCVVGDGEAETGPLAASWHSNKFLNPARDGVVLPILHLNGYKIANPTVLSRIAPEELDSLMTGYGYKAHFVEGSEPAAMHRRMAAVMDEVINEMRDIRQRPPARPRWPMIVLRSPKGWTGPQTVDGQQVENHWRSHQVPFGERATGPKSSSMRTARRSASCSSSRRRERGAWDRTRMRTAACCSRICACPTSRAMRSTCRGPALPLRPRHR